MCLTPATAGRHASGKQTRSDSQVASRRWLHACRHCDHEETVSRCRCRICVALDVERVRGPTLRERRVTVLADTGIAATGALRENRPSRRVRTWHSSNGAVHVLHEGHEGIRFSLGVASAGLVILAHLPDEEIGVVLAARDLTETWGEAHSSNSCDVMSREHRSAATRPIPGWSPRGPWDMGAAVFDTAREVLQRRIAALCSCVRFHRESVPAACRRARAAPGPGAPSVDCAEAGGTAPRCPVAGPRGPSRGRPLRTRPRREASPLGPWCRRFRRPSICGRSLPEHRANGRVTILADTGIVDTVVWESCARH